MNKMEMLQLAAEQHAADYNCTAADFFRTHNIYSISKDNPDAKRYLELPFVMSIASYGSNLVVSADEALLPALKEHLDKLPDPFRAFELPQIYQLNELLKPYNSSVYFMSEYFLPDYDAVKSFDASTEFEIKQLSPDDFSDLYLPEWSNALCKDRAQLDVLAVGAYDKGQLVGLAGCSADARKMWQIGIDVLPEYRRHGIASLLTNTIAKECFRQGRLPFYGASWANIRSIKNALRSGFRPAWSEITAKSN